MKLPLKADNGRKGANRHLVLHYGDLTDATNLIRYPEPGEKRIHQSYRQLSFQNPDGAKRSAVETGPDRL